MLSAATSGAAPEIDRPSTPDAAPETDRPSTPDAASEANSSAMFASDSEVDAVPSGPPSSGKSIEPDRAESGALPAAPNAPSAASGPSAPSGASAPNSNDCSRILAASSAALGLSYGLRLKHEPTMSRNIGEKSDGRMMP